MEPSETDINKWTVRRKQVKGSAVDSGISNNDSKRETKRLPLTTPFQPQTKRRKEHDSGAGSRPSKQ